MDFVQNCWGYWKSFLLWAILLRLPRLDSLKYVVELGHVLDKGGLHETGGFDRIQSQIGNI